MPTTIAIQSEAFSVPKKDLIIPMAIPCRHRGRLIEAEHEVRFWDGTPDAQGNLLDTYTTEVHECDQYGKCTPERTGPADAAICAGCRLYHAIGDETRDPEKPRSPGNWRRIPGKRVYDLQKLPRTIESRGPVLWGELHRWALAGGPDAEQWLAGFAKRLPCGECRKEWGAIVAESPPTGDLFEWSVDAHNRVNRRLGKPELTVADALAIWNKE